MELLIMKIVIKQNKDNFIVFVRAGNEKMYYREFPTFVEAKAYSEGLELTVLVNHNVIADVVDLTKDIEIRDLVTLWVAKNINKFIKYHDGLDIIDIVVEPGAHPHYHSARTYALRHNGESFVIDMGLSGSPSCWNWYDGEDCCTANLIDDLIDILRFTAEELNSNKEVEASFVDCELASICDKIMGE